MKFIINLIFSYFYDLFQITIIGKTMNNLNTKYSIFFFLILSTSSVMACSCKHISTEIVAYSNNHSLTKLEIQRPSIIERILRFNIFNSDIKRLNVKVLEDIKGTYNQKFVDANTNDYIGECGVNVEYGQQLYLINTKNKNGQWSHSISACNIVGKNFASTVKAHINNQVVDTIIYSNE